MKHSSAGQTPEKIGLSIEFEVLSIDVDVKLGCSRIRNTDYQRQEVWVLTQLKCRRYHDVFVKLFSIWVPERVRGSHLQLPQEKSRKADVKQKYWCNNMHFYRNSATYNLYTDTSTGSKKFIHMYFKDKGTLPFTQS